MQEKGSAAVVRVLISMISALLLVTTACARAEKTEELSSTSLDVTGLTFERELLALYLGDFPSARIEPDGLELAHLFRAYVNEFSKQCAEYLPENKAEITVQECARERTRVNQWGTPVGPSECVAYRDVPTGRYADPEMWRLTNWLDGKTGLQFFGELLGAADGKRPQSSEELWAGKLENVRQMADVASSLLDLNNDMESVFRKNPCDGEAIARLEQNLKRFAQGSPPLRLQGGETLADVWDGEAGAQGIENTDYERLIDDLIADNSKGWALNSYKRDTVTNVSILARRAGMPEKIRAEYAFLSFGKQYPGSVAVTFEDGLPACLYFSDAPDVCRLPSRAVLTAYEKGTYRSSTTDDRNIAQALESRRADLNSAKNDISRLDVVKRAEESQDDSISPERIAKAPKVAHTDMKQLADGIRYFVVEEGSGEKPELNDQVTLHYVGRLEDGTVFDSSRQRNAPTTFALNQVIPCLAKGLQLMQPGARYALYCPADQAYGQRGAPPVVPPNASLNYDVELIAINAQ